MKKLIIAAFALFSLSVAANAQAVQAKKAAPEKMKSNTTGTTAKVVPIVKNTPAAKPVSAVASSSVPKTILKKDGTPDKRYKANTAVKKDGTPDMRYKANKAKPQ